MWQLLFNLFPQMITAAITAYNKTVDKQIEQYKVDGTVNIAALSSAVAIERAKADVLIAEQGHFLTRSIRPLFGLIVITYMAKVVTWDNIVSYWVTGHAGHTPAIEGSVGVWMGVIVSGFFLHGIAVESIKQLKS